MLKQHQTFQKRPLVLYGVLAMICAGLLAFASCEPFPDPPPAAENPKLVINDGAEFANTTGVTLTLTAENAVSMWIADDADFSTGSWEAFSARKQWELPPGDGEKRVYVQLETAEGAIIGAGGDISDNIILDMTPPAAGSIVINNAAAKTNSLNVTLGISVTGAESMWISNSADFADGAWETLANEKQWEMVDGGEDPAVYVMFRDAADNMLGADGSISDTIILDCSVPLAPLVTGATPTNDQTPQWSWNQEPDIVLFSCALAEDGPWTETTDTSWTPAADLAEGTYTLYVKAQSEAGNWSEAGNHAITVDITPPPQAPIPIGPTPTREFYPWITWEAVPEAATYQYQWDDGEWFETANTHNSADVSLDHGDHTIYVKALDAAGNATAPGSFTVSIDHVPLPPPTGLDLDAADDTGRSQTDNITNKTVLTIHGRADGVQTIVIIYDCSGPNPVRLFSINTDWDGVLLAWITLDTPGPHIIRATTLDNVHNESDFSDPLIITIDLSAEIPSNLDLAANDDTGISNADNITKNTTALTVSGIAEKDSIVSLYDGQNRLVDIPVGGGTPPAFSRDLSLSHGVHEIRASLVDLAGNVSTLSLPLRIIVDTAPPKVNAGSDIGWTKTRKPLNGSAKDNEGPIGSLEWSKVNGPVTMYFSQPHAEVTDAWGGDNQQGKATVQLAASDVAGNIATDSLYFWWDKKAPIISLALPSYSSWQGVSFLVKAAVDDGPAGVGSGVNAGSYLWGYSGGRVVSYWDKHVLETFAGGPSGYEGDIILTFTASDLMGNTRTVQGTVRWDAKGPTATLTLHNNLTCTVTISDGGIGGGTMLVWCTDMWNMHHHYFIETVPDYPKYHEGYIRLNGEWIANRSSLTSNDIKGYYKGPFTHPTYRISGMFKDALGNTNNVVYDSNEVTP